MPVSFKTSKEEARQISKIVKRATQYAAANNIPVDVLELHMDITACHANGCPLALDKMLNAPEFDFVHDVFGIQRHINRETGEMGGCFLPRCAAAQHE